jgi:hypothetical protein
MSSELRELTGEMRAKDQRTTSGMRAEEQLETSDAKAKQARSRLAESSPFARTVILVTERRAVGRVASQESWLKAGGRIDDGQR